MAAKLLIYHMDEVRMQAAEGLCAALGIQPVRTDASEAGIPIGLLTGSADIRTLGTLPADREMPEPAAIDEEMVVVSGFTKQQFDAFLDGLKEMSLRIGLKAVETPFNRNWSGEMLQAELKREREEFRKRCAT